MEGGASRVTPSVAIDDKEPVQVVADPPSEFSWKREALQFAAKKAKLFGDKFAWEQSSFSGVFGKHDLFSGTMASGYKSSLAPTSIGLYEVLQSEIVSSHGNSSSSTEGPPVERLVLRGARREAADEDIRRLALFGDPAATQLGCSLRSQLEAGSHDASVEQSFERLF